MAIARADLAATLEKRGTSEIPGVDMAFPLKDYDEDLERWATDVEIVLTDKHQEDCRRVRNTHVESGCGTCRGKSCGSCYWPKTVRYWRRVEAGGRFADAEGYAQKMKAPTTMVLE